MTKNSSKEEDAETPSRVDKTHGGELVEAIAPGDLTSFNDADCKHEKLVIDPTETDFKAFMCANPNCNEVMLYDKE